ncbi:MAG: GNAT family N-acetyltransferase [Chitinophagaceae bacterium]|nr:GNAT family N-acetyltransferase [Oligoflexus sp.]
MTVPFRIREAGSDDNERLIALSKRCPTRGPLSVYSDRFPDFFAMTRQQGERSFIYVGETYDGEILGCVVLIERMEQRGEQSVKVLHLSDLRVDPRFKRSALAALLIQRYSERLQAGSYHHGITEILKNNAEPSRANNILKSSVEVRTKARVTLYKLFPAWNYRVSKAWTYRQATPSDYPKLSKLLQSVYRDAVGAPSFSLEWLQAATQKHSSFTFANIWLALDDKNEIKACLARWDQQALRKTVVVRSSKAVKFIVRFLTLIGFLWRLPPLPKTGKPLDYQYFRWLAATSENMPALRSLLRFAMRKTRDDGKYQFALVGFHDRDRLKSAVRGIIRHKEPMHIYSHRLINSSEPLENFTPSSSAPVSPSLLKQALYVDASLI